MFRFSSTLAIIIFACHTQAQTNYYQCTDRWGQPVFSQNPCGVDAQGAYFGVFALVEQSRKLAITLGGLSYSLKKASVLKLMSESSDRK